MITSKDFKRKLTISGGQKKTKACLNLELITGKEIYIQWRGEGSLLTNILCRNCVDKNETIVRKILEVRESFASSRVHWSQEKYWRRNLQQQTSAVRSVRWSTSTGSALHNEFFQWRSILNCFSVDEKCGGSCWESRADFQISVNSKTSCNCCFNRKSRFIEHSLTSWSPRDIQGTSDWLEHSDPFLGR